FVRADEASLAAVFRAAVGAATRSLCGLGAVRTAAWPTASLSQRLLRAGFCDPLRHHPAAGCAYSREELSAPWFATVSAAGGKRGQMLVAYGVRRDGRRHLLAFLRRQGESQADWEGLLQDLYRRGLEGKHLALIVTDGCAGLAAAIPTVYPRARHQRCWVH